MNKPILKLRENYDLVETISRETIKHNDTKYLCVVFKCEDGSFSWYYHDYENPYCFHDIATGFDTSDEAKKDMMYEIGV